MVVTTKDRRNATRFTVTCDGELAAGTDLQSVQITDISVTGCGLDILDDCSALGTWVGRVAVLNVGPVAGSHDGMTLPVVIRYGQSEGATTRLGLEFPLLSPRQTRALIGVFACLSGD